MGDNELVFPSTKNQVGTVRYMSPEVLADRASEDSIEHSTSFDKYIKSDVYSFALVMWEVMNRTTIPPSSAGDRAPDHSLPYYRFVEPGELEQNAVIEPASVYFKSTFLFSSVSSSRSLDGGNEESRLRHEREAGDRSRVEKG